MIDLCLTCQQNTSKLLRSANLLDRAKSECILAQQDHLNCVETERDLYRNICAESKRNFDGVEGKIELDEAHEPCSVNTTMHYSFDSAQHIHIPSNPMQPGPIYFKTPHKCGIFCVMCEAVPWQVNCLIDEASEVWKEPTQQLVTCFIIFKTTVSAKVTFISMLTGARDRIKITASFGT